MSDHLYTHHMSLRVSESVRVRECESCVCVCWLTSKHTCYECKRMRKDEIDGERKKWNKEVEREEKV